MEEIVQRVYETAVSRCRIRPGRLLVAVSGGPDSVALLYLLLELRDRLAVQPVVAHVHHQLRAAADEDLQFCRELAQQHDLPFVFRKKDVRELAKTGNMSIETAARQARYTALETMADEQECHDIALGHTANDQAETVLFNVMRGSGLRGLAGMPYRLGRRIRPLLDVQRQALLQFLKSRRIPYRTDESNFDTDILRNRIRLQILPYLKEHLNPGVEGVLYQTALIHQEAEAYIQARAKKALHRLTVQQRGRKIVLDIEAFWRYFSIIRKYILRNALERLSRRTIRPDFRLLERIENELAVSEVGKRIGVREPWELLIDHDGLVVWDRSFVRFSRQVSVGQEVHIPGVLKLRIRETAVAPQNVKKLADNQNQFVDADQIDSPLTLRNVQPGDQFQPLGLHGHKKVHDVLADRHVPLHLRPETPVLECKRGIVWVVGHRIDDRFKVSEQTKRVLHLQFEEDDS